MSSKRILLQLACVALFWPISSSGGLIVSVDGENVLMYPGSSHTVDGMIENDGVWAVFINGVGLSWDSVQLSAVPIPLLFHLPLEIGAGQSIAVGFATVTAAMDAGPLSSALGIYLFGGMDAFDYSELGGVEVRITIPGGGVVGVPEPCTLFGTGFVGGVFCYISYRRDRRRHEGIGA